MSLVRWVLASYIPCIRHRCANVYISAALPVNLNSMSLFVLQTMITTVPAPIAIGENGE